jgi:hypothetical protein
MAISSVSSLINRNKPTEFILWNTKLWNTDLWNRWNTNRELDERGLDSFPLKSTSRSILDVMLEKICMSVVGIFFSSLRFAFLLESTRQELVMLLLEASGFLIQASKKMARTLSFSLVGGHVQ